jgi:hypothetical protein
VTWLEATTSIGIPSGGGSLAPPLVGFTPPLTTGAAADDTLRVRSATRRHAAASLKAAGCERHNQVICPPKVVARAAATERGFGDLRGSSEHGVLLVRLADAAWQRGVGTTSLSPALPRGVQGRLGVLLCGGLHQITHACWPASLPWATFSVCGDHSGATHQVAVSRRGPSVGICASARWRASSTAVRDQGRPWGAGPLARSRNADHLYR